MIEIACNAASIYNLTNADSPEEAILKLTIFGQTDKAKQFEEEIKLVRDSYKKRQILPTKLNMMMQKEERGNK